MKYVEDVEWSWEVSCPECGHNIDSVLDFEIIDDSGCHPIIKCDNVDDHGDVCGCEFTVSGITY